MKAHVGVDQHSGLVHTVVGTGAHVADITQTHALLHGQEKVVFADAGYLGASKRPELVAKAFSVRWHIAAKRSQVKALPEGRRKQMIQVLEKTKAQVRALVEHPFHIIKNLFKHRKVRYRGLAKNTAQLYSLFALANLVIGKAWLVAEA